MRQPKGYVVLGEEYLVCRLKKSLYRLKQAHKQWYIKFDTFMCNSGFHRTYKDQCCYFKKFFNSYIVLLLYVDNMLIAGSNLKEINKLKKDLSKEFEMKDLGLTKQILGMRISRGRSKCILRLSWEDYVYKVLNRFRIGDTKPWNTPLVNHFKLAKE